MYLFTILLAATAPLAHTSPKVESIPVPNFVTHHVNRRIKRSLARVEYLTDPQVAEFERHGLHHGLGKLIKHRDDTGGVHSITWEEEK